jgi:hypothetical protein
VFWTWGPEKKKKMTIIMIIIVIDNNSNIIIIEIIIAKGENESDTDNSSIKARESNKPDS